MNDLLNKLRSIMVPLLKRCGTVFCFFRTRRNYKRHFSVFTCLVFIFIAGCSTARAPLPASLSGEKEVITDYPEGCSQYKWIHNVPESTDKELYFVGLSNKHATERDARNQASIDCINQFARYCRVKIKLYYNYLAVSCGKSSKVTNPTVAMKDSRQHIVEAFASRVKPQEFCAQRIEKFSDTSKLEFYWKAYALATVPVDEVQKVKDYKPPEPPPPLSLHLTKMGNNRYCIDVRSHLGMPITNFQIIERGCRIFPNELCVTDNEGYRITGRTATLDFTNRRSILLGGNDSSFNFRLTDSGSITAKYSINNQPGTLSQKY